MKNLFMLILLVFTGCSPNSTQPTINNTQPGPPPANAVEQQQEVERIPLCFNILKLLTIAASRQPHQESV